MADTHNVKFFIYINHDFVMANYSSPEFATERITAVTDQYAVMLLYNCCFVWSLGVSYTY